MLHLRWVQDGSLSGLWEHIRRMPLSKASPPERQLGARWIASAQQERRATQRRSGNHNRSARAEGAIQTEGTGEHHCFLYITSPEVDSGQDFHPDLQLTFRVLHPVPQPPVLELGCPNIHTGDPGPWRLFPQGQQVTLGCTQKDPRNLEGTELAKCCGSCL